MIFYSIAVPTCDHFAQAKYTSRDGVSFHRFPEDPINQSFWVEKCKLVDIWNPSMSYVCSKHFESDVFVNDLNAELMGKKAIRILKPRAVPSVNLSAKTLLALKDKEANKFNEVFSNSMTLNEDESQVISVFLADIVRHLFD